MPDDIVPEKRSASAQDSAPFPPPATVVPQDDISPEFQKQLRLLFSRVESSRLEIYAGPLPHPDILARYEQVVPGSGTRLIGMAEKQADHRQHLERVVIEGDSLRAWAGVAAGFIIGLAGMATSARSFPAK